MKALSYVDRGGFLRKEGERLSRLKHLKLRVALFTSIIIQNLACLTEQHVLKS